MTYRFLDILDNITEEACTPVERRRADATPLLVSLNNRPLSASSHMMARVSNCRDDDDVGLQPRAHVTSNPSSCPPQTKDS